MSNIWKFSSLSEPYMEKWLQKAVTLENNNKWSEKFKHVNKSYLDELNVKKINEEGVIEGIIDEEMDTDDNAMDTAILKEVLPKTYDEDFCNVIDSEPLLRLDYMIEKCLENPKLISQLAEHLEIKNIEKICNHLFINKNEKFISIFLTNFFPPFLKRDQCLIAYDLLTKANNAYPDDFKLLLMALIKNIDIKNSILQEFMQNSNIELKQYFISVLMHINVTSEIFQHHLYTILIVYKDYKKTENLQIFIQKLLIDNALFCIDDKNYGRLFFTFLQTQKTLGLTPNCILEKILEQHKTPFKRSCLSILNEIK